MHFAELVRVHHLLPHPEKENIYTIRRISKVKRGCYTRVISLCVLVWGLLLTTVRAQAQGKVVLTALDASSAAFSLYKIELNLAQPLRPDAEIRLVFPPSLDVSSVKIAGSNDIRGGIRFTARGNSVTLKRTGLGAPVPAGKKVAVFFGPIRNPDSLPVEAQVGITLNQPDTRSLVLRKKINFE